MPDAATGAVGQVSVIPPGREVSVTDSGLGSSPQTAWDNGILYASSDKPGEELRRSVEAWDLTTGTELWHVRIPSPDGSNDGAYRVEGLHLAPDGALYLATSDHFSSAVLHRLDAGTGEITGTWALPKSIADASYRIHVVDETVIALATGGGLNRAPGMMLLRTGTPGSGGATGSGSSTTNP